MELEKTQSGALRQTREQILTMPPEKALDAILSHPQAASLVKSFSAQDLYFLIHEIGLEDSTELLSLASTRQWQCIVDLDVWRDDQVDYNALTRWMACLLAADPDRLVKWMAVHETELWELWLYENVSFTFLEHDQDPNTLEPGYFTLDGVFYAKIKEGAAPPGDGEPDPQAPEEPDPQAPDEPDLQDMVEAMFRRLSAMDVSFYHKLVFEVHSVIPSESMENLFRIRNLRLAERGFLPPHEAAAVYQGLDARDLDARPRKILHDAPPDGYARPFLPPHFARRTQRLSESLASVDNPAAAQQIERELVSLCNQVVMADRKPVRTREDLASTVKKCSGLLNMGLDEIRRRLGREPGESIRLHRLEEIFQVGFGLVLDLKFTAQQWRRTAWFQQQGLPLSFWGEERLGVVGGLLLDKPLFYNNFQSGALYREFESLEDVEASRRVLMDVISLDSLFSQVSLDPEWIQMPGLTCESLLLTPWARDALSLSPEAAPLSEAQLRSFFQVLMNPETHAVRDGMKQRFLDWVGKRSTLPPEEITDSFGACLNGLFLSLEGRYGRVAPGDLDVRYMDMFWVKP